jgi:DNA-binding Lrp family transcriptional regulator
MKHSNQESAGLDALDRRILRKLQRDASLSHADLAVAVSASAASCWRRVKALEASGILGPAVRLLDQNLAGCGLDVLCQVRMAAQGGTARQEFETFVQSQDEVMECYSTSGEWDYLLRVVAATVADYEAFLMRKLLSQPSVATSSSHFAMKRIKYKTELPV